MKQSEIEVCVAAIQSYSPQTSRDIAEAAAKVALAQRDWMREAEKLLDAVTVCEAKHPATGQWCKVEVLARKESSSACRDENDRLWWASEFRPIQPTAEQVREALIEELAIATNYAADRHSLEAVIDAGYRKP